MSCSLTEIFFILNVLNWYFWLVIIGFRYVIWRPCWGGVLKASSGNGDRLYGAHSGGSRGLPEHSLTGFIKPYHAARDEGEKEDDSHDVTGEHGVSRRS